MSSEENPQYSGHKPKVTVRKTKTISGTDDCWAVQVPGSPRPFPDGEHYSSFEAALDRATQRFSGRLNAIADR
jgi:hypothetical protein